MADSDANAKPTSPYDYPKHLLTDPKPEELVEDETGEGSNENPDTNDEKNEGQNNEEENTKNENESTEVDERENDENEKKDTEKPLLEDNDSIKIDITPEGEDTPTLPLPDKKRKSTEALEIEDKKEKTKLPKYLFPFTRIKNAWNDSSNVFQFLGRAICIIFQTVGWFTCVGGIPFVSLVMLIIGSIYVHQCRIQPNIPIYLIVSGLIGTIQHFMVFWTKYVPKESKGRLKVYRSYCRLINALFHIFLLIWFIIGCVWVYSVKSEVEFSGPEKDEYCHETLYLFAYWIFNLSFILMGLLLVLSVCFFACAITAD